MDTSVFINELQNKDISFVASKWLIEKLPFIFNEDIENIFIGKNNYLNISALTVGLFD